MPDALVVGFVEVLAMQWLRNWAPSTEGRASVEQRNWGLESTGGRVEGEGEELRPKWQARSTGLGLVTRSASWSSSSTSMDAADEARGSWNGLNVGC